VLSDQCLGNKKTSIKTDLIGHRIEFSLDDTIHGLKSLDQSSTYITQPSSAENIDGIIATRVQYDLLASTSASSPETFDQAQIDALIESRILKVMLGAVVQKTISPYSSLSILVLIFVLLIVRSVTALVA
jgi:hypothetical protein